MTVRILVVDDDAFIRLLLSSALPDAELVEAWRADSGIELARSKQPDVIIVDRRLPDGDGLQLVRQLRADPALRTTPILFFTATHTESDRLEVFEAGADEYLSKTNQLDDLASIDRRIARLLAIDPHDRPARRARLAARIAAGETGDIDPLPAPAPEDEQTPKRRWFRRT